MQAASYITIYAEKSASAAARAAICTDARDKDFLLREARKYENLSRGARESAQRDAKAEAPAKIEMSGQVKAMRRFFAVAKKAGLNVANKKGMRAALSAFLGCEVKSRAQLTAADFGRAVAGIERGMIWW